MANKGKFIDRSPMIFAAGKSSDSTVDSAGVALEKYHLEDHVADAKDDVNIWHTAANREAEHLKETYGDYWKKELEDSKDHDSGVHAGSGSPPDKESTAKEQGKPKLPYEVLEENQIAQGWYKKTHEGYNPSEDTTKGFGSLFHPTERFGGKTTFDPRGIWVRCHCDSHSNVVESSSSIEAHYLERTKPQLGKVLAPNHNIDCVPKGHTFGKTTNSHHEHSEVVKDVNASHCLFKKDFYAWLDSLNKMRLKMKERRNKDFDFDDFYKESQRLDKEKQGWLPLDSFNKLCASLYLRFENYDIDSMMRLFGVISDDRIDYKRFIELININSSSLRLMEFNDIPDESKYHLPLNEDASCDYFIMDDSGMMAAGKPSIRHDLIQPLTPFEGPRADGNAINHNKSIDANHGLTHRELFMPRSQETLRTFFEKVGYKFPGNSFEKLWKAGVEMDKTGSVCVDTFNKLLEENCEENDKKE